MTTPQMILMYFVMGTALSCVLVFFGMYTGELSFRDTFDKRFWGGFLFSVVWWPLWVTTIVSLGFFCAVAHGIANLLDHYMEKQNAK